MVLGHFGAFRQLFLHIVRHMKHFFKLITMWAVEGEKLQYLGFASDRFIQRDILFTVADCAAEALKAKTIPASASQIFFMINSLRLIHWR